MTNKVRNSKAIKVIGLATISLLLLSLYMFFFYNNLEIVVFNKTAYNIDSLKMDNKYFSIKKGDSLFIDNCKIIYMQGELPFGVPYANIEGKTKDTSMLWFCGTGVEEIINGQYKFDITISENRNIYSLYWQGHK